MYQITENSTIFANMVDSIIIDRISILMQQYNIQQAFIQPSQFSLSSKWRDMEGLYFLLSDKNYNQYGDWKNVFYLTSPKKLRNSDGGGWNYVNILSESEIPEILPDNVLWNIHFNSDFDSFNSIISTLRRKYQNRSLHLMNYLLRYEDILEHPCKVGLCHSASCHGNHSNLPRLIDIESNGAVYPRCMHQKKYCIGNIKNNKLFSDYIGSPEHKNYLKANCRLFFELADKCSLKYIPWMEILGLWGDVL